MSSDEEKSIQIGTLCDVKGVEKSVSATDLKELVCVVVDTISTDAGREVHAKLHVAYKTFAKSTTVEGKLTDGTKLEFFNRTRTAVSAVVTDLMEVLSFGVKESTAVAKLISAGAASERVGYMKSPPGINMSQLLSKARDALRDRTGPNTQAANTNKNRSSTEFWSADESRPKAFHRRRAVSAELSDSDMDEENDADTEMDVFDAEARDMAPQLAFEEEEISQKERRRSLELIAKVQVPGGQFNGTEDKRSVRKMLRWIKQESEDKCLTPLETYFLLRACFKERQTRGLARAQMKNQNEVQKVVVQNISQLLAMFAPTLQQERNRLRRAHIQFRPKFGESLQETLVRYDELVEELDDFDIILTEMDKISVFTGSLKDEDRLLAVTVQEHSKNATFMSFKSRLFVHSQVKQQQQYPAPRRFENGKNTGDSSKDDGQKGDNPKMEGKQPQNRRPQYQRPKKTEANNVDQQEEHEEEDYQATDNVGGSSSEAELNLVEIGIAPEDYDYVRIPITTENNKKTPSHYSKNNCRTYSTQEEEKRSEVYQASIANEGPKAAMLEFVTHGKLIEALVDSGATKSLVSVEFMRKLAQGKIIDGAKYAECEPLRITYADGRTINVKHSVTLPVKVKIENEWKMFTLRFLLLPKLQRGILLGRDAMDTLGIQLTFRRRPVETKQPKEEKRLREERETEFCMVMECNGETAIVDSSQKDPILIEISGEDLDHTEKTLMYNDGSQQEEHPILHACRTILDNGKDSYEKRSWTEINDEQLEQCAIRLLRKLRDTGWMEISEGYRIRIVEMGKQDKKDTAKQQFRFEVNWSVDLESVKDKRPWNSQSSIDRLSDTQQTEWRKQIDGYVEQKWWIESQDRNSRSPAATVFPVLQCSEKTTTVRPCSDFRLLNDISPRVSSTTPSVGQAVWRLRCGLQPGDEIHQLDLAKAFYRIHTHVTAEGEKLPLVLKIGNKQYTSNRLVFGLACGPQALICSQLITDVLVQECANIMLSDDCKVSIPIAVMDDFIHTGSAEKCSQTIRLYDIFWQLSGFDCPGNKRAKWNSVTPVRWLGQHYLWDTKKGKLSMVRSPISFQSRTQWTKRQSFAAAGQFTTNTCSLPEALARTHADCVRAIAGKTQPWDAKLSSDQNKLISFHLGEALKSWDNAREQDQDIALLHGISSVDLFTDASAAGMGMVLSAQGKTLFAEGKLFKESSKSWHVNRRELYALARAVLRTDSLIDGLKITNITAHTDSRVARAQTDPWRNITSKSLERQVLMRLKNCINEISSFWKLRGTTFTVKYIQGETNIHADALSRVRSVVDIEVAIAEVSHQIDELRGFTEFKTWFMQRELFFLWRGKPDPHETDPASALRLYILHKQESDPLCQIVRNKSEQSKIQFLIEEPDGIVMRKFPRIAPQILIPDTLLKALLEHVHRQSGHASLPGTLAHFFKACYHPKARKTLKKVIASCEGCNRSNKRGNGQTEYGEVQQPPHPFHTVGIDLYGPLQRGTGTTSNGKKCIFTFCDRLTGWTQFRVLHNGKSPTVARALEEFLYMFGPQIKVLYSDGGPQFAESPIIPGICKMWGIQQRILPPYTPHLGGFYEIRHKTATAVLRSILAEKPLADWQTMANIAAARINSLVGPDRTSSPHKLIFGWDFSLPSIAALENASSLRPPKPDDALFEAAAEMEARTRAKARDEILEVWKNEYAERQNVAAERFNSRVPKTRDELRIGDKVYLVKQMITRKFDSRSTPFRLIEKLGKSMWRAKAIADYEKIIKVHAKHLRKAEESSVSTVPMAPTPEQRENNENDAVAQGSSASPPDMKKHRTTREHRFLDSINGQVSRSGRLRRGRMNKHCIN
jgi:hypothetical protein